MSSKEGKLCGARSIHLLSVSRIYLIQNICTTTLALPLFDNLFRYIHLFPYEDNLGIDLSAIRGSVGEEERIVNYALSQG